MTVRLADKPPSQADIAATMAVMTRAFPREYGEAWTEEQLRSTLRMPGVDLFLIGMKGTIDGFALTRTVIDETELLLIAISPDKRRLSLARNLLEHIEDRLREQKVLNFFLEMRSGNPAEELYRNHGFKRIGLRPNYYRGSHGGYYDAVTFGKSLLD